MVKRKLKSVLNVFLCLLALVAVLHLVATFQDDPLITPFRALETQPDYLYRNTTKNHHSGQTPEQYWQQLLPSRRLLAQINPDILIWLEDLYQRKRIAWHPQGTLFNWPVLASYVWYADTFYLGPKFWGLGEGDKAAVIAHEYFHARQNKLRMVNDTLNETLSGRLAEYGSRTEDEAHIYQYFAYQAMGMEPSPIVLDYFRRRRLWRFINGRPHMSSPQDVATDKTANTL